VREVDAFQPAPRFELLEALHVTFDDLLGNRQTEAEISRLARGGGHVVLVGASGSGKSSILAHELGQLSDRVPEDLVPMRIPMEAADPTAVTDRADFARHIISHVVRSAAADRFAPNVRAEYESQTADIERRTGQTRRLGASLNVPLVVVHAELAAELASAGQAIERRVTTGEVVEALQQLLEVFRAQGLEPFLVFDDTDVWLRSAWGDESQGMVAGFFGRNIRMLAREVACGFALAAHEEYLDNPGFRGVVDLLESIRVPAFPDPEVAIKRILGRRLEIFEIGASVSDVLDEGAIAALAAHYDLGVGPNLRALMQIVNGAVRSVLDDDLGPEQVNTSAVRAAVAKRDETLGTKRR
jgi:hypothetical protein